MTDHKKAIIITFVLLLIQATLSSAALDIVSSNNGLALSLPDNKISSGISVQNSLPQVINRKLFKEVLGFYPSDIPKDEYKRMPIEFLSTIAWFGVFPRSDGALDKDAGWPPIQMITDAHAKGVKVIVVVASGNKTIIDSILASPAKQSILADNLLSIVESVGMDGLNVDFEYSNKLNSVSGNSNRRLMVDFIRVLSSKFWSKNSMYHISIDLPVRDGNNLWDVEALQKNSTALMIMGYDINNLHSREAGPTAPLDGDHPNDPSIRNSINIYLAAGVKREKLLLGVPYYGYLWPTIGDGRNAATIGKGKYISYVDMINYSKTYGRRWDNTWKTPWFAYKLENQWYQGHYDDIESLSLKYDLALAENLGGIGIWQLGYGAGRNELWQKIKEKFADIIPPQVSILNPPNGSKLSGMVKVEINATDDYGLSRTILYLDGIQMVNWTAPPFKFLWNSSAMNNGVHELKAKAEDYAGNLAEERISVIVNNKPLIATNTARITHGVEGNVSWYIVLGLFIAVAVISILWNRYKKTRQKL